MVGLGWVGLVGGWMAGWLAGWLVAGCWLVGWLAGWLVAGCWMLDGWLDAMVWETGFDRVNPLAGVETRINK